MERRDRSISWTHYLMMMKLNPFCSLWRRLPTPSHQSRDWLWSPSFWYVMVLQRGWQIHVILGLVGLSLLFLGVGATRATAFYFWTTTCTKPSSSSSISLSFFNLYGTEIVAIGCTWVGTIDCSCLFFVLCSLACNSSSSSPFWDCFLVFSLLLLNHSLLNLFQDTKSVQTLIFISNGFGQPLLLSLIDGVEIHLRSLFWALF